MTPKLQASQAIFLALLKQENIPAPVPEFRFHPVRKWRFDYCWIQEKVALEVDGGTWARGRHTRGSGWAKDTETLWLRSLRADFLDSLSAGAKRI